MRLKYFDNSVLDFRVKDGINKKRLRTTVVNLSI